MSDEWQFWRDQLAGGMPETTPGTPHAGFFRLKWRTTRPNDDPNRRPGDPRNKVTTRMRLVAIWKEAGQWHMLLDDDYSTDVDWIDSIFSQCCRNAIEHDEYEALRHAHRNTENAA